MIVRGIDSQNDWLFGKGKNDYKTARDACAQNIKTRLQSFLANCFFSLEEGIDWFNLLGSKNRTALMMSVRSTILNTPDVISIVQVSADVDDLRNIRLVYNVNTVYGNITTEEVITDSEPIEIGNFLLAGENTFLTLEAGGKIIL